MQEKTIVTHDSKFHADDVFAVAALLVLLDGKANVIRTREHEKIHSADFVVDVGAEYSPLRDRFDHHQKEGAGARESGIPYASFGLVWKKYGENIAGGIKESLLVDSVLVAPTDAEDNGVTIFVPRKKDEWPYEVSDAIASFVPSWNETSVSYDERFMEAVAFARKIIQYESTKARAEIKGVELVENAYKDSEDKRLVVLDGDYSWDATLARFSEPLFVVHPRNGMWYLECVRDEPQTFVNRKNLPESWGGLRNLEFAKVTGVSDSVFCHRALFMAVARSRDGALALAKLALAN